MSTDLQLDVLQFPIAASAFICLIYSVNVNFSNTNKLKLRLVSCVTKITDVICRFNICNIAQWMRRPSFDMYVLAFSINVRCNLKVYTEIDYMYMM